MTPIIESFNMITSPITFIIGLYKFTSACFKNKIILNITYMTPRDKSETFYWLRIGNPTQADVIIQRVKFYYYESNLKYFKKYYSAISDMRKLYPNGAEVILSECISPGNEYKIEFNPEELDKFKKNKIMVCEVETTLRERKFKKKFYSSRIIK